MKKVISACVEQLLEFDTQKEAAAYLEGVRTSGKSFRIVYREEAGEKYRIRIQLQYNKSPLIEEN